MRIFRREFHILSLLLISVTCDWPCVYPPPCTCDYVAASIDCRAKGLSAVPAISHYLTEKAWFADFSYNNISSVPDWTFANLSLINLNLEHNNVHTIGENVFRKSKYSLQVLSLQNNNLTELPSAIGKLQNLYSLSIQGNPIREFKADILRNLSNTLGVVAYGSNSVTSWPTEINILLKANQISVYGLRVNSMPEHAFSENLFILKIIGTSLFSLSNAIDNQPQLYQLFLENNTQLTAEGLGKGRFSNISELTTLSIKKSNLDTLPAIFNNFSKFMDIEIKGCPIRYLNNSVFPPNEKHIYSLTLENALFNEVPPAFSSLKITFTLFLINGKIQRINENDFNGMTGLIYLHLYGNPIANVSDLSFKGLPKLKYISFADTLLDTIPKAIQNIPRIETLDMSDCRIECSCRRLGWMKSWIPKLKRHVSFSGDCFNIHMNIPDFIKDEVPKC